MTALVLITSSAQASIYKCVNQQGAVYYNDKPCPIKNKETKLKAVKDPTNRDIIPPPLEIKQEEGQAAKSVVIGKEAKDQDTIQTKDDKTADIEQPSKDSSTATPATPAESQVKSLIQQKGTKGTTQKTAKKTNKKLLPPPDIMH